MAEYICRALRDGGLEGEHAPTLTIKDSTASAFGFDVFAHVLSQLSSSILAGKSQSRGLVLVAFSRSPSFYVDLLKTKGVDVTSLNRWIQILDCYTDPLGWKDQLMEGGNILETSHEASSMVRLCKDVRNLDKLYPSIIELGKGLGGPGKVHFTVAIDSVSETVRHTSVTSVAGLLSSLRSNDLVSSIFCLLHSDLHEVRVTAALEYLSSMVASVEPSAQSGNGQRDLETVTSLGLNFRKGKFHVRIKRRNGRVRVLYEEFQVEQSGMNFTCLLPEDVMFNQGRVPKVHFNLELSEKERIERAKVVLPFEHQGNGRPIQIYDGRKSLTESKNEASLASTENLQTNEDSGNGEIIYFRDSDDDMPDSDEDPDDDLDI